MYLVEGLIVILVLLIPATVVGLSGVKGYGDVIGECLIRKLLFVCLFVCLDIQNDIRKCDIRNIDLIAEAKIVPFVAKGGGEGG